MTALAAAPRTLAAVGYPGAAREAGDVARAVAALKGWRLLVYYCSMHRDVGWVAWYRVPGGKMRRVVLEEAATWL